MRLFLFDEDKDDDDEDDDDVEDEVDDEEVEAASGELNDVFDACVLRGKFNQELSLPASMAAISNVLAATSSTFFRTTRSYAIAASLAVPNVPQFTSMP
jgi:hypothetical protein